MLNAIYRHGFLLLAATTVLAAGGFLRPGPGLAVGSGSALFVLGWAYSRARTISVLIAAGIAYGIDRYDLDRVLLTAIGY